MFARNEILSAFSASLDDREFGPDFELFMNLQVIKNTRTILFLDHTIDFLFFKVVDCIVNDEINEALDHLEMLNEEGMAVFADVVSLNNLFYLDIDRFK